MAKFTTLCCQNVTILLLVLRYVAIHHHRVILVNSARSSNRSARQGQFWRFSFSPNHLLPFSLSPNHLLPFPLSPNHFLPFHSARTTSYLFHSAQTTSYLFHSAQIQVMRLSGPTSQDILVVIKILHLVLSNWYSNWPHLATNRTTCNHQIQHWANTHNPSCFFGFGATPHSQLSSNFSFFRGWPLLLSFFFFLLFLFFFFFLFPLAKLGFPPIRCIARRSWLWRTLLKLK